MGKQQNTEYYADLKENISFWLSMQPKECSRGCYNINSCKEDKTCENYSGNGNVALFERLKNEVPESYKPIPSPDYVRKIVAGTEILKKTSPIFTNLNNYLTDYKKNPCKNNEKLNYFKTTIRNFYKKWLLDEAIELANEAINDIYFPLHPDIIRLWALVNNRNKNWTDVRNKLEEKLSCDRQEVKTECYIGIFESYLNDFTQKVYNSGAFEKLETAKEKYLDKVPNKENNGQYHYFYARFLEEQWLISDARTKLISQPLLLEALDAIEKSIEKYENKEPSILDENSKSEYSGFTKPFWLYCHKCILLKLLRHNDLLKNELEYYWKIIEPITQDPDSNEQRSAQIYAVTYFLLKDTEEDLHNFLSTLELNRSKSLESIKKKKRTIVDNYSFRHVDLIFFSEEEKKFKYIEILNEFFRK